MHLHIRHIHWIRVRVPENPFEERELITLMRSGNRDRLAAVVGVRTRNHPKDGIIVSQSVFQTLEDDGANGVCSAISACGIIKWIAVTYKSTSESADDR